MTSRFGLFPLNTVVFPGLRTELHVFEDRYRALVRDLLALPQERDRVFGITAIREGFEVGERRANGDRQGIQHLHRIGTLVQLTEVEPYDDGRYDIEVVGRDRFLVRDIDTSGDYSVAEVSLIEPEQSGAEPDEALVLAADRTLATFEAYRQQLGDLRGAEVVVGTMPRDPTYLSWALSGTCLLTLAQRQELLEAEDADERLGMLRGLLREEMRAMRAVPSLPATELARMQWSPN